ncbi:MAG: alkene reductase [Bryobacterales bacterium]|nr:alkene reductase [Bryobacterales bacterium]
MFTPYKAGEIEIPNRVVMAPMTRSRADENAAPTALTATYYAQRAQAGLLITEGTSPSADGLGYARTPAIYTPQQVEAWRQVTDAVHAAGGRIVIQLMHVGRIAHALNQPDGARVVAPSAIAAAGTMWTDKGGMQPYPVPHELTIAQIAEVVDEFAQATRNARDAGFDGVELHAANGYLPNQFLAPNTNLRTDAYGGSIENRGRFVLEVYDAMAAAWSADRVGIRVSPGGTFNDINDPNPKATHTWLAAELAKRKPAFLHIARMGALDFDVFATLREVFPGTLIANGGLDFAGGQKLIEAGTADLVSYARLFISNPDLPARFQNEWPLAAADNSTFYTPGAKGYTDYPAYPA